MFQSSSIYINKWLVGLQAVVDQTLHMPAPEALLEVFSSPHFLCFSRPNPGLLWSLCLKRTRSFPSPEWRGWGLRFPVRRLGWDVTLNQVKCRGSKSGERELVCMGHYDTEPSLQPPSGRRQRICRTGVGAQKMVTIPVFSTCRSLKGTRIRWHKSLKDMGFCFS